MRPAEVIAAFARAMTALSGAALAVMMAATCFDIASRSLLGWPLHGVVEIVEITVLLVAFLGLPEMFLKQEAIQVDIIDGFVSPQTLHGLKLFGLVVTLAFLALLTWTVLEPLADARRFGDVKPDLGVPLWWLYSVIVLCFAASVLTVATSMVAEIGAGKGRA
ncbi:TRAP transporter small permease [Chelatococcus sp. GCM10030263]|uniref:TRAP transporter small permease n=1 Tax=Chelatococcus sp. GCM10030263 TaxID=3273387 RepID=UPI0036117FA8